MHNYKEYIDLGKYIAAKVFEMLPKVQYIAQSGHPACTGELLV